jgi:hypothetical protein
MGHPRFVEVPAKVGSQRVDRQPLSWGRHGTHSEVVVRQTRTNHGRIRAHPSLNSSLGGGNSPIPRLEYPTLRASRNFVGEGLFAREACLLDHRRCVAKTAEELDDAIREIFKLDEQEKGDQITGTLHVDYSHESVKEASLVRLLESRGVRVEWRKTVC